VNICDHSRIEIFSTSPQSKDCPRESYIQSVSNVAQWSEEAGCTAILVYTDNSLVDPWLVAQIILQTTKKLCPLVAIQPIYMHPYTVAKMVASFSHLYGRRVYLNMVAGGFKNDLLALNDTTAHDDRYVRLVEYTTIVKLLLASADPVSYEGKFYKVDKLRMTPPLALEHFPEVLMSGSSDAALAAARAVDAVAVQYPKPAAECEPIASLNGLRAGVRVGIIARETNEDAWAVAYERFPADRRGQIAHQLAMKISDSQWHNQISSMAKECDTARSVYWTWPFENYKTFCPYLVGSYQEVSEELSRHLQLGYRTFILDIPPNREELRHVQATFQMAAEQVLS
jgi:Coenzyme F420-dependent N5,N10-methylene tetrahydromethanopterin reductase and related flavin-dependent oxidoreductases